MMPGSAGGTYLLIVSWDMITFPMIWNRDEAFLRDVFTLVFTLLSFTSSG
jgi:hypothetical protein